MLKILKNEPLALHTTFRVGGTADFFVEVGSPEDLAEALTWASEHATRLFILGGGSNIVFLDEGFRGLVIKTAFNTLQISGETVQVGSNVTLAELIHATLDAGLVGLEFAAGIPGTVGGAIRGNAGTFGVDMESIVDTVSFVDTATKNFQTVLHDQCDFRYRHSMFKSHPYFIYESSLTLTQGDTEVSRKIIADRINVRLAKHPTEPSAGCVFKNIQFKDADLSKLQQEGLELDKFKEYKKIPAGYLIEMLGLKGKQIGGAQVSEKHGNYIINTGAATADEVIQLISLIKQRVRDTYAVQLEEEVHIVYNQ